MNQKDEALRIAAKAFLIIRFGGSLTAKEGKMFCDLCCLALPMKYRFEKFEFVDIEAGVRRTLAEQAVAMNSEAPQQLQPQAPQGRDSAGEREPTMRERYGIDDDRDRIKELEDALLFALRSGAIGPHHSEGARITHVRSRRDQAPRVYRSKEPCVFRRPRTISGQGLDQEEKGSVGPRRGQMRADRELRWFPGYAGALQIGDE
jgi:hypothetical protein